MIYKVNLDNKPVWNSTSSVWKLWEVEEAMQEQIASSFGEGWNTPDTPKTIEKWEALPFSAESPEQLKEIIKYWERMKAIGEGLKKGFWAMRPNAKDIFSKLIEYRSTHMDELLWKYEYLGKMKGEDKKMFIKKYLRDHMLYGWLEWAKSVIPFSAESEEQLEEIINYWKMIQARWERKKEKRILGKI